MDKGRLEGRKIGKRMGWIEEVLEEGKVGGHRGWVKERFGGRKELDRRMAWGGGLGEEKVGGRIGMEEGLDLGREGLGEGMDWG